MGEVFGQELRRLRDAADLSREQLSRLTVRPGDLGISASAIEALETKTERNPDDRTVLLLGRALATYGQQLAGLEFAEARRLLDERQVGHDAAVANLARVRLALVTAEHGDDALQDDRDQAGQLLESTARRQRTAARARNQEAADAAGDSKQ